MPNANTVSTRKTGRLYDFLGGRCPPILGDQSQHHPAAAVMVLWGVPFVVIGQYMVWGRFLYDAWLKPRTYYGITNRRVLIL